MALDLSNLKKASPLGPTAPAAPPVPVSDGKPLQLAITEIEEDPNQPRKEFTEEKMAEMEASIRLRGVRQPVSVRPHPEKAGKWLLNWGARRYRGSIRAGMTTIPAFIDDTSDDFDQVIENEARDNLKPMELAMFIRDKIENAGMKKAEVARRLARPASTITELLSLVDAPASIEAIYRSGRCTSPKTLYELRSLHEKFPAEVDAWCEGEDDVTRKSVLELGDRLKGTTRVLPSRDTATLPIRSIPKRAVRTRLRSLVMTKETKGVPAVASPVDSQPRATDRPPTTARAPASRVVPAVLTAVAMWTPAS